MRILIGTRGSKLALAQTSRVAERISELNPEISCENVIIKTTGDMRVDSRFTFLPTRGIFVKELEEALLKGRIDIAVHSMKDLPTDIPPGLTIAAMLEREDPRDVLVSREDKTLETLPPGSRVGTGSIRRVAQLKRVRDDLEFVDIRGNIDTRLRKLDEGQFDAIVVALAGLKRLGLEDRVSDYLDFDVCIPAVGQGAVGVEARIEDPEILSVVKKIDHLPTRLAVTAERTVLTRLGGGCSIPIAANAIICGKELRLRVRICDPMGKRIFEGELVGDPQDAVNVGRKLAEDLLSRGANEFLQAGSLR